MSGGTTAVSEGRRHSDSNVSTAAATARLMTRAVGRPVGADPRGV